MHFYNNNTISDRLFGSSLLAKLSFTLLGVFLLTASAKVSIPFFPVPMTLQTFVIYFLAASSGMLGFSSALLYVSLGLAGLPIFAAGGGIIAGRQIYLQHLPSDQIPTCAPPMDFLLDTLPIFEVIQTILMGDGNCAEYEWRFVFNFAEWAFIFFTFLFFYNAFFLFKGSLKG